MKRVINGKTYNTDTAIELHSRCTVYETETIYMRKSGELFYFRKFGVLTEIIPTNLEEIKEWVTDRYGNYFYGGDEEEAGIIDGVNYGLVNEVFEKIKDEYFKRK